METSEVVADIFAALAKAQAEFQPIKEDAKNEHLGYRYTTLAGVLDATRATLASHGLGVIQTVGAPPNSTSVQVTTAIIHASGQWVRSTLAMPYAPHKGLSPAQTMGVAITYARRYALMAMLGVSSVQDDNDAAIVQPVEHTHNKKEAAAQDDKAQRTAWLKQQLEGYKDNLQTTKTEQDVTDCVGNLIGITGELPDKTAERVRALTEERVKWLKDHPSTGFGKDAPDEADSAAVNLPEAQPKPNGAAEYDSPLAHTIHGFRDAIRKAQDMKAIERIQVHVDTLYDKQGDAIFSEASARAAWMATTEFLSARRKLLENQGT